MITVIGTAFSLRGRAPRHAVCALQVLGARRCAARMAGMTAGSAQGDRRQLWRLARNILHTHFLGSMMPPVEQPPWLPRARTTPADF